ncbi:MAG: hypothetical protein Q7S06_02825 [Nanoarchaeota archaeon]|nr:hypothetical protein [Nanoarchaeota archaeon]
MAEYFAIIDKKDRVQGVTNGNPDLPEGHRTVKVCQDVAEELERRLEGGQACRVSLPQFPARDTDYCPLIGECGVQSREIALCVDEKYLSCRGYKNSTHLGKR